MVFDFDDTIINGNSDTWIYRALPNGVLPEGIRQSYVKGRWTEFMNAVFQHFEEEGIDERNIRKHISEMPLVSGMSVSHPPKGSIAQCASCSLCQYSSIHAQLHSCTLCYTLFVKQYCFTYSMVSLVVDLCMNSYLFSSAHISYVHPPM